MPWGIQEVNSLNKGFIDKKLFDDVQARIRKKPRKVYTKINDEEFPLKGNIECGSCSQILRFNHSKGRSKNRLVELRGIEPRTPCLQSRCSPS